MASQKIVRIEFPGTVAGAVHVRSLGQIGANVRKSLELKVEHVTSFESETQMKHKKTTN